MHFSLGKKHQGIICNRQYISKIRGPALALPGASLLKTVQDVILSVTSCTALWPLVCLKDGFRVQGAPCKITSCTFRRIAVTIFERIAHSLGI
jgi:hypothetical protein